MCYSDFTLYNMLFMMTAIVTQIQRTKFHILVSMFLPTYNDFLMGSNTLQCFPALSGQKTFSGPPRRVPLGINCYVQIFFFTCFLKICSNKISKSSVYTQHMFIKNLLKDIPEDSL